MTWYNACTEAWAGRRLYGDRETCEDGHSSSWRQDSSQLCCKELPREPILLPPTPPPSDNNLIPGTAIKGAAGGSNDSNLLFIIVIVFLFFLISAFD